MVIVCQPVRHMEAAQSFVEAWRPYAAKTYDPQTSMPTGGAFEIRTTDDWKTAMAYCWLEPH